MTIEHLDGHMISAEEAANPMPAVMFALWKWDAGGWRFDSHKNDGADAAKRAKELEDNGWEHVRIVSVVLR